MRSWLATIGLMCGVLALGALALDQIALSVRGNNEVWLPDHSTPNGVIERPASQKGSTGLDRAGAPPGQGGRGRGRGGRGAQVKDWESR